MRVLCLLYVVLRAICWTNAASHSLQYIYTVVTGDTDSPEFIITGLVNDEQFVHYDSNIRRMIPQSEWREISVDKQYWDKQTQKALYAHQIFKDNIVIAMQHFRSTQGVHILEWIVGCQWNDETGDTGGIDCYEYDGKYFLTDDMKTWHFIPPAQQLFISAVKWNPAELENDKQFQTQICIESLTTYVSYRSTLERTVAPEVSLLQKDSFSPVITCHVTGFYPRDIMVTWQRNGEDLDVDVELGETVRNEDGTFQTTSHLTVKPEDWKNQNYTCTVQHKSLKQDIVLSVREENIKRNSDIKTRSFNPEGSSLLMGVIVGCVVGALILPLAVIGFVIWTKRHSDPQYTFLWEAYTGSANTLSVAPEVSLLQKDSSSPVITCHVTRFYPRDIMVTWQRNGKDLDVNVELGEMVRNEDRTFQTTSHLTVKPEDWKSQNYTCTVQHKSLKQDIVLPVREENIKRNSDIKSERERGEGERVRDGITVLIPRIQE